MSDFVANDGQCTPLEIAEIAQNAIYNLDPIKSIRLSGIKSTSDSKSTFAAAEVA